MSIPERELVLEVERMRTQYGILRTDRSPSRMDSFVKTLEEERNHYKAELEKLERTLNLRASSRNLSRLESSRRQSSPDKVFDYFPPVLCKLMYIKHLFYFTHSAVVI